MGIAPSSVRRQAGGASTETHAIRHSQSEWRKRMGIEPTRPVATHAAQTVLKIAGIQLTTAVGNS